MKLDWFSPFFSQSTQPPYSPKESFKEDFVFNKKDRITPIFSLFSLRKSKNKQGFNDEIVGSNLIKKSTNLSLVFDERNYLIARDCNPSSSKKRRNGTSSSASYFSLNALMASSECCFGSNSSTSTGSGRC